MWLISRMDPIFEKPDFTGKISRWKMLLSEFDIVFVTRRAIKGQAIADYLADQPLNDPKLSESLFLEEDVMTLELEPDSLELWRWKLYFDGDRSLSTTLPRSNGLLKMFWFMPMGNIPQWDEEKIRLEKDVSLEK